MLRMAEALSICIRFSPLPVEKRRKKMTEQMELSGNAPELPGPAGSPGLSPRQNDSDDSGRKEAVGPESGGGQERVLHRPGASGPRKWEAA